METSNLFFMDEIPLKFVVYFRENLIENIHISILKNENRKGPDTLNESKIDQKIKTEIDKIWKFLDQYFKKHQTNHLAFYDHIIETQTNYGTMTPFNQKIYRELCKTNSGDTLTYRKLAISVNSRAFRAVGSAMKNNRFPIIIPCHRVIAQDSIGGYMGLTSKLKMDDALFNLKNSEIYSNRAIPDPIKIKILLIKFERS